MRARDAPTRSEPRPGDRRPVLSQYWNTEAIPDYIADLLATFRDRNPDFRHLVCDEAGAEEFIGTHFGPREVAAFRACAVPSMQSDYFRYCVVLALGGVYSDADYECVRPLRPLLSGLEGGEIFLSPTEHPLNGRTTRRVWSAFFAFRGPGHPFLALALEIATANIEARISERIWPPGERVVESIWLTVGPGVPTLMRFILEWGSFDAFVEGVAGSPMEPFAQQYCEVIGDYDRIVEAFEGVRVSSAESMFSWVGRPEQPLPYKDTDLHWQNVRTRIFRP
jgi:Glycosyltransferase sugar-binding region containing DXD motif